MCQHFLMRKFEKPSAPGADLFLPFCTALSSSCIERGRSHQVFSSSVSLLFLTIILFQISLRLRYDIGGNTNPMCHIIVFWFEFTVSLHTVYYTWCMLTLSIDPMSTPCFPGFPIALWGVIVTCLNCVVQLHKIFSQLILCFFH
jgi:hypothetical protein